MNICMVPARKGSVRLAKKNYLKIGEFTVLEIALIKAIKSKAFDRVVIKLCARGARRCLIVCIGK